MNVKAKIKILNHITSVLNQNIKLKKELQPKNQRKTESNIRIKNWKEDNDSLVKDMTLISD